MRTSSTPAVVAALAVSAFLSAPAAYAQSGNRGLDVVAADKDRVTGEIVADFGSRKWAGATGVDVYTITSMKAADLMTMNGTISSTPERA